MSFKEIFIIITEGKLKNMIENYKQLLKSKNISLQKKSKEEVIISILENISNGTIESPHMTIQEAEFILETIKYLT